MNDNEGRSESRERDMLAAEWDDIVGEPSGGADANGRSAFVVGIVGDSGSGKSTVADAVAELLGRDRVADLRLDDYQRFTRQERAERGVTSLNPSVHNLALLREHLRQLRAGETVQNRTYSHADGTFGPIRVVEPREIVVARGLLGFPSTDFDGLYDLSVFLFPEPELLFRWKLRRDVLFRGYTEAEVLKNIADHLLDAKEFLLPQADLADVVVEFAVPEPEAPDTEVATTMRLRRAAAEVVRSNGLLGELPVGLADADGEVTIRIPATIGEGTVRAWAARAFDTGSAMPVAGAYHDETGAVSWRASLALVELLIARLCQEMAEG